MSKKFSRSGFVLALCVVAAQLGAACSGGEPVGTSGSGGGTGGGAEACQGGLLACGTSCVDARVDPENCGKCGDACAEGEVCSLGTCGLTCGGGLTLCVVAPEASPTDPPVPMCIETSANPSHCGACNAPCATGEVCQAGACATECVGGTTKCQVGDAAPVCVDTALDPSHCGDCTTACAAGQVCQAGACVTECVGGTTKCEDPNKVELCVDVQSNTAFCGDCMTVCAAGEICSAGKCALSCVGGTTKCGNACTNTQLDPANCGICGKACSAGLACVVGKCQSLAPAFTTPLSAGEKHSCALSADGFVKCWGRNFDGQLGLGDQQNRGDGPNELGEILLPIALGTGKTAKEIAAGLAHTCATLNDGSVKCWGYNGYGQLGIGNTQARGDGPLEMGDYLSAVPLGTGKSAAALASGVEHTCVILNDASIKCWGRNLYGQLGLGDTLHRGDNPNELGEALATVPLGGSKNAKSISLGAFHSCAILNDDSVKCWGYNGFGQLGLGDTLSRGDNPTELGDLLLAVPLGAGKKAVAIASGYNHTCALLDDASVKCWGGNYAGQLGLGNTQARGDGPNEMGDLLPSVSLGIGKTAKALAAGRAHTCAVLNDNSIKCWGSNNYGQLGLGDVNTRGDGPNEGGDLLLALSLGTGKTGKAIELGGDQTCAVLNDDSIKCWGLNFDGQLGLGDTLHRGDEPNEMGDMLLAVLIYGP
ncbi:MAG: hypothetical protein EXR75_14315 [Myxococcales bacterium]|nr:hypothetical protein [Myxococcales bacterium]